MYINCKTWFSYHYGTFSTNKLVEEAVRQGVSALALTNINGTPDVWKFVQLCREAKIKPILGCEIRNNHRFCYLLLAKNEDGLMSINKFLSIHKKKDALYPLRPELGDNVYIIYQLGQHAPAELSQNELIGVKPSEISKLFSVPVTNYPDKFVIRQPVTFQNTRYYSLHRLLRAIALNTLYTKLTDDDIAGKDETFKPEKELVQVFQAYPTIISRTKHLIEKCKIKTDLEVDKTRKTFTGSEDEDKNLLRKLAFQNIAIRYPNFTQEIADRIEKELDVIDKEAFNVHYLMVWDVVQFARSNGFYYVGRGSGANSIIAYLLQITDVDPIKLDLYFERFLNKFRSSPPDFDIDFSHKDRNAIIEYIFKKYGEDHVALLGMYSTFKHRAVVRELGKVMGLPKAEIDNLVRNPRTSFKEDSLQRKIQQFGNLLNDNKENFPNHHSIHAGGMLISEKPIYTYSAQEMPPKGFPTSQLDMFEAETIGLVKLDILSQRGLGHIKDTIELVRKNRGIAIDITRVEYFMQDEKVASKIRIADSIGCFYIESPAMRQLLMKLKCDDYLTLVAASSIIRPGVAQSGMMKTYIYNYHHPDKVQYLHPKMEELLQETYGVMVYQEDVIKVAHHFGGLDMAESDILRRAMSGKYRGTEEMDRLEGKFFANCKKSGYPEHISREVWRQIASFSGYSFSKAHSASFAVESYQSLYLKTYYPMEFMVGVINNFGGFYRTEVYFHELKRAGAKLHAPCVNYSELYTSITEDDVYVGLIHVEKLTDTLKEKILKERQQNGLFMNLHDFIERVQPGLEQLNILIRINALRFTGINKKDLLWKANFMQKRAKEQPAMAALFQEPEPEFILPELSSHPLEDAMDEIEILGFSLGNMFDLADTDYSGITLATELECHVNKEVTVLG
ncbi:MAG: DNA polymerase III subunit alpha, partial [Sphingobacteriaceae bacterium]